MLFSVIDLISGHKAAGGTCVYMGGGYAGQFWWLNQWLNPFARC